MAESQISKLKVPDNSYANATQDVHFVHSSVEKKFFEENISGFFSI